jgi:hypothetical protein
MRGLSSMIKLKSMPPYIDSFKGVKYFIAR